MGVRTTSYGLKFETLPKEDVDKFDGYDKCVAECHIQNCGCIIIDAEYKDPIDNEYDLAEIYSMLENE